MKRNTVYIFILLIFSTVFFSCSTQKNTGLSRAYQNMVTRFNIYFNGAQSYKEGFDNIDKANRDDYSQVLPMYPISNHANTSAASSNMDRAIEKSRKAIKLHSIKKKPEKNYKKWETPKYKNWYNQNEFNPALKQAWLMLGKAEFHKGDFLGSVGTFSYISKHYSVVPEISNEAQLWIARAYTEMDWLYEAEEVLGKLANVQMTKANSALYSAFMANLLLKRKEYRNAIPYLKLAIDNEKDGKLKERFNYIMAQIQSITGDNKTAANYYSEVIKSSPPYEMDFNARINRAQLSGAKAKDVERELKGMAKSRKNKDYLDQIYTAVGNVFMAEKDTVKAVEYYTKAIEKSARNSVEKGVALVKMADMYYNKQKYVKSFPYYDDAAKIYTKEYFDFQRISHRAEVLGELTKEDNIVTLQDSLLRLAAMPEKERLETINKIIEKVKKDEKEEKEKQLAEQNNAGGRNNFNRNAPGDDEFTMPPAIGMSGQGGNEWYFYNINSVKSGQTAFKRTWGNRKLEDDWRRNSKSSVSLADNKSNTTSPADMAKTIGGDSNKTPEGNAAPDLKQTSDNKSVDFYLAQLPFTDAQRGQANVQIADAMFNEGYIYKDKVEDPAMAIKTFAEFERRFAGDERVIETIYQRFLIAAKQGDKTAEESYRAQILAQYPQSNYAKMLSEPNYIERLEAMNKEQDSIYGATYAAYTKSDFPTVFKNAEYFKKKYPLSPILPKFEFLNALSIGKTQNAENFKNTLNALVETYPQSDVSAMSKDILALMKQGNIVQKGLTHGSLLAKREESSKETPEELNAIKFTDAKDGKHRLLFVGDFSQKDMNRLLYYTAMFNFTRFMIKDFDFAVGNLDEKRQALSVTGLESFEEAQWYERTLKTDNELKQLTDSLNVQFVPVSEDNFGKLKTLFTLEDYLAFENDNLLKEKPKPAAEVKKTEPKDKTSTAKESKTAKDAKETPKTIAENIKTEKTVEKQPEAAQSNNNTPETKTETPASPDKKQPETTPAEPEKPKVAEEPVVMFRNTYAYRPNAQHLVTMYFPTGGITSAQAITIKQAFDRYNAANYGMLNLSASVQEIGKQQIVIVSYFVDANTAKSYFLRMLKEPAIVEATKGLNKRNLIGTQENIGIMLQKNDLNTYFEFMKEFYLK